MRGKFLRHGAVAAIGIALAAEAGPAFAQAAGDGDSNAYGEIIVTARKRSESLQDVPASIVAVGQEQIAALNAKSLADLGRIAPNTQIDSNGSIAIRGVRSNTRNIGFEAGAAVYIDGVYQGRPIGNNQDLLDIERVEVLRGPQGTLYGKNTTAGAISLVTVRPGDTVKGAAEIQYGSRDDIRVAGYVAGPLVEGLVGMKIAAYRQNADGFQKNLANGDRYGNRDTFGGRAELRLTPGQWDIALRGDYARDGSEPAIGKIVAGFAVGTQPAGRDNVLYNVPSHFKQSGGGVSLTADYEFDSGYTLTSITAWRSLKGRHSYEDDYSPLSIVDHDFRDKGRHFTQELRVASPAENRFSYILGAYYFDQALNTDRQTFAGKDFLVQGVFLDKADVDTRAYALFASADYRLTDNLTLNGGLRYTHERKTIDFLQTAILTFPALDLQYASRDNDLSPTVSLTWKVTPDVTTYVRVSRGFKSGGWNPDITATPDIGFDSEKLTNYEIGVRARTPGGGLSVNLTGYYMDYKDLQVLQFLGPVVGNVITNAGAATMKGLELEMQARPARWLNIAAGGAFNDATYDRFESGTGTDYAGQQIIYTPRWTGFVTVDARLPVAAGTQLLLQADYSYESRVHFDNDRTVFLGLPYGRPGHGNLNARIGVALDQGLELVAFAENLTDKRFLTNRFTDGLGIGSVIDFYSPPRQFGVRLGYRF